MPFPKDRLVATEYQPFDAGQPPAHFGERTGIQSVITSPWVLRWASIPATYATYRQIRKHGTIAMARELKVAPVLASEWTIDADDDVPDEWKTLIEKTFFPLRDEFMAATLYYGDVDFGYTCFEKIIEPKDGYLKIVRFKPLLHDITEICIGHHGDFIGVRQLGKDLGLANSVHVGFRVEGSYLYGIPLLENARQAYNWWIDCNEGARRYDRKIAGAHIVVEYPVGTSTDRNGKEVENADLARTVLDSLEAAGGVAVPRDMAAFMQQLNLESPGWKIWILDAGASQQATFVVRLEYLDKQLCRCLHIPERAMMEGQHGTLAEAEAHADVIFTIQDIEHRRVTAELNRQAVDQVLVLNFGRQAAGKVRLKASPIVDEKKAFFKEIYAQLLASPAGQRELQSLDAGSLREQLGLPQVQNDPGDIEHDGANLQAIPGLSAGQPGGDGKAMMARGPDGQPVTVPGEADNPATALANAVWGMREAVALSSTALRKAEAWAASNGTGEPSGEPLELAGNGPAEQVPWQEQQGVTKGGLSYKTKFVPLGDNDYLHFESLSDSEGNDPDVESVREQYGLDYPHEVLWGRGPRTSEPFSGKFDVTGEGKAGQMISHASQALRELVDRYKPVSVEFSAREPSRQKAYHHMMRRLTRENIGNGEYVFLHEPGQEADRDYGIHGKPAYFHIVHRAAADLPRYEGMEPIEAREPVAASGATMADVLGARPIGGRIAENMTGVACANTANTPNTFDLQEKTIAPAIDYMGPDGLSREQLSPGMVILQELRAKRAARSSGQDRGYANMSPGQRILFELRARRGDGKRGYGFANETGEPPEAGGAAEPSPSMSPRQQADVHALARKLAANGSEATVNMIIPSGQWREQPPHAEGSEHKTRLAEAVANAVSSGALQKHPTKTKIGRTLYIPGEKFEHFNRPIARPPRGPNSGNGGGGQWTAAPTPPSPESEKFIEEAGLHPRQLADIHTLVRMMQTEKGRLGAGRIDELRGKWRSLPPHVPGEYKNRHEEARGMAVKLGVFQPDDPASHQIGRIPYVAGPNYQHFLQAGEAAVVPAPLSPIGRRGHGLGKPWTPTGWENHDPFADYEAPEDKWPRFPGKQKEINLKRFAGALDKISAPEEFEHHPRDVQDMLSLLDTIENGHLGERARAILPTRLSSSRRSPYWTGEPRDKKSAAETHFQDILGKLRASGAIHEAPSRYEGRIAAYAPKAGPTYDYLAGLAAAAIRPRAAKAKQPAAEKLNKEQAWQQEIGGAAKSLTGLLQGTAAEKAQQEADPQAQREWQKAASQDFGQDIRERMHNERKTRGADVPLKLNRIGELLHDSLKKYDPSIDGPFDQWYDKAHDEAARLADHEIRSETAPVAGFKGKSLDAPVKSKTGDEGGTVESMTGGDVKQNIEALQEPKGKMEVIRRKAARMIHHLLRDTRPQTRDARIVLEGLNVEVAQKMGEGAWLYLKRMLDGKDPAEARAKWIGANHSMVAESRFDKMRNRVIEIARQRFPADHPNDRVRRMHDAMELLLDTPEVQANPVKATNRAPGEGPSPGYLILSNLRQQRVAREGGILL